MADRARVTASTLAVVVVALATAAAQATLPNPIGRINDFAALLDEATESELDTLLEGVERETTAQVAVATVSSLGGLSVDDYATKLFNAWGVGQKGKDNGVLVLVAPVERAIRIEVGYGLEDVLTDGLAGQIIRDEFTPAFRDGNYQVGILAGVRRIAGVVRRNERLTPEQIQALAQSSGPPVIDLPGWAILPFTGAFVAFGSHVLGLAVGARVFSFLIAGVLASGVGAFLSYLVGSAWALVLIPVSVAMLWWGLRRTRDAAFVATLRGPKAKQGGWIGQSRGSSGGRYGSSSGGGSRSGGSFGGGRSGGGGASGRW